MSNHIYQQYAIYDREPSGVLRVIRRFIGTALGDLGKFQFANVQEKLNHAQVLANALQLELESMEKEPKC